MKFRLDYKKILICFIEKFDEIIDWATMNQLTNEWGMYTNIKNENYSYLTNYLHFWCTFGAEYVS